MDNNFVSAFPVPVGQTCGDLVGLSLRDYFAAKAMQALIAKHAAINVVAGSIKQKEFAKEIVAGAYHYADVMLAAREAKP